MTDLRSTVSVSKTSAVMGRHILQLIHESFLDKNYQTNAYWKVTDIKKIDAPPLENSFECKKLEMEQERTPEELKEEYLFTCYKSNEHINIIAIQGLHVQQSKFNFLGDSLLGVILCKHADIQLKAAQNEYQPKCWLMVFKVMCGRKLAVHPAGNVIRRPTDGADCHVSSIPPVLGETLGCQAIKSQVYLYETDPTCVTGYSVRPRQCVPQAYVEFISCSGPATSLPPVVHLPYPGIISHQRISSPLSHHTSASDLIRNNQRISQNGAAAGSDIQLASPAVSLCQQFPPYVPKSSCWQNRQRSVAVISQPANALPTYSSVVNSRRLKWQQLAAGAFVGEGSNNTSRIESNTSMVNSGHTGWQQVATRPCVSEDCNNPSRMEDNRLQVLLLNRTLVIELLQMFAKEMNAVAGVWKESGCNVESTSCLKNAILAVQELRLLFMQIAPVCQQFYRFAQDLFSGKTDSFPSLTVVQHQLKCLRTCQSTMSTAFKYFNEVTAQTTDSKQKGIMMAQAVLSKQLLLMQCLTSLQGTLLAFNGFHANISGVVTEEHAKQSTGTPDLPVQNSAGTLYNSNQHSFLRQPDLPTTAPKTASTISPSLASLFAMSGGEIGQLSSSSRQESANSVCIRNNRACELQRDDSPSSYDVRRICAERKLLFEREEAQSDLCSAENSSFQFGLRLPIVIAPDDGLVDEVVSMNSTLAVSDTELLPFLTSIKQEKTTSRDKRNTRETIFIDADELIPECIVTKNEEVRGDSPDTTRNSSTFGLVLDILDEQNPGSSLARVFCVSPDGMDESEPDSGALSSSHIGKEQQSKAETATTVEDCSSEQTLVNSDNEDLAPSAKYDSFMGSTESEEVGSVAENAEPEFVVNIEPTTEEPSDSETALSQNLDFDSQAENSNSQIIADPEFIPGLSGDVHDTLLTCAENESLQLEKTCVADKVEVDSVVQISIIKKKKCVRQKPKAFVKHKKLLFLRKSPYWTRRSYGRKKPTTLKETLTIKPKSVNRKCRASKALLRKSNCKQVKDSGTMDAGDVSAKVSNAERLQIAETAEVVMPGLKKTDDVVTENLSVVDFPVAESQDSSDQDLSANTCLSRDTCTDTACTDEPEKFTGPSLAHSHNCDVDRSSDNILKTSFLITSASTCNSEATFADEQPFQNICAIERDNGSALICNEVFAESMHVPLRTAKSEPVVTDFDLADEQKPRFSENQEAVDDEIIAEVVASAAEFDSGNMDDSDDAGFLKIRIENVCSIAPEGFDRMNYSTYIKTESEVNVEVAGRMSCEVATSVCNVFVKPQSSFKMEDAHDGFKETAAIKMSDLASEVVTDVGGTRCLIRNSEGTTEVISVAQPTCLINVSSSQSVVKEQTCQEEELVDVGDAEYSTAVGQSLAKTSLLKDRISDLVHGENFDDCDVEFDVLYENTSDENEDDGEENEQNDLSKCTGSAESEMSDEVLKFYSLGGDNYETADVHSTLDLMTLSVKTAPTESTVGAESARKQVKKRKRSGAGGRKRRRKKSTPNAVKKAVKGKLAIENQDSELVIPQEQSNETVSERVVESGKKGRAVKKLIPQGSSETQERKRFGRKQIQESNISAFLVSAEAEKFCCALPELGLDSTVATELEGKSVDNDSTDVHGKSLCSESQGPDLLEKGAGNLELPKLDEKLKADVDETELEGEENEGTEEICEKDIPSVEDLHQIESVVKPSVAKASHLEKSETTKTKKRKRRYAMTGRSKRRKRTASQRKTYKRAKKFHQNTENSDTNVDAVEASEQGNDDETDQTQLLPLYDEGTKCAEIPEAVLNLFVKGTSPVESSTLTSIRTSPRTKAAVLRKQSEFVKPKSRLRQISKLRRKRRTSSKADNSSPEPTLLDMLNDDMFLETLKSAVKTVEGISSVCRNSSEPAVIAGIPEELETSVEESNPVYFTDIASALQDGGENSRSSNVNAEPVNANSENVDYLNCWKSLSEEHLQVNSLGNSVGTSSTPYSENDEIQTSHCVSAVSYSALINAVDSASSSISYDAIRSALETVASSKGVAPSHTIETVELRDHAENSLCPNSVAQLDISMKDTCSESAESYFTNFLASKQAADTSTKDSSLGGGHASAKTVIPLSVYLRNVRQSNNKIIKDTESNHEPAFYTGVVKAPAECPTYVANQEKQHHNQIYSRDPRLARMKHQSGVVPPLMQLQVEPKFQNNLPILLAYYSSGQNIQEAELQQDMSFQSTVLTSPVPNRGSFPGYFHSFSNTENPLCSNPLVKKPVCSITPFIHESEKTIGNEQQGDSVPTVEPSKPDAATPPIKLSWDGSWQLIPISNLPPRPPIIFARLHLSERKIDCFPSDPRIRSEKELSVRRQLSRPDNVCDDVPLVIDGADASANIKPRRASGGVLSSANSVSKKSNNWDDTAGKGKDWFFQGKPQSDTGDVTKCSPPENLDSQASKSKLAPADDILNDLLSSLHTESFEGERIKTTEAGVLCGLNKDRVLGKRLFSKLETTSDKPQQKHHSSIDGRSPALAGHKLDRDNSKRDRDRKNGDKPDQITDQRNRDKSSHLRTSSHRHHTKDNIHSRRDHSSRRDIHHRDSSRTRDDKSSRRSDVKPRLDVNSEGSAVSLISTDPVNKAPDAEEKRPNEECIKKRQHSADEKAKSADERKRFKKSPLPSSCTPKDERRDYLKSLHCNKQDNLKVVSETEKAKGRQEPKKHDTKTRESTDEALQRKKSLKVHSSRVDNDGKSCLKQYDNKQHGSRSRDERKSIETVDKRSDHKEIGKSRCHSQGSSSSKERLHGQDKGKHEHRREHVEKRRSSHGSAKEHTNTKDGDCSKTSHSVAKVRHELVQSPTAYSCLQENFAPTEDIHVGVSEGMDVEAKDMNNSHCAVELLDSTAETLVSRVSGAGAISTQDLNVDFTEAEEEHEDGSLVIHMEGAGDEKESHLDCILPRSSCIRTVVHNDEKVSDTNERETKSMLSVSLCSMTDEASPSDEKLTDEVGERDDPRSYKSCYEGESLSFAPRSNTQIRADILKSIRSLKSRLEDKLKSDVDVSDVCGDSKTLVDNSASSRTSSKTSNQHLPKASKKDDQQQAFVKTSKNEMQKDDLVSHLPYSDTSFDEECGTFVINEFDINLETEESIPRKTVKTSENNSGTLSADGSSENSFELSNFSSSDLVGNLSSSEEKTSMLHHGDGSHPAQNDTSSDLSTKSDYSKSSFSSLASVRRTKSLVSSACVKANENASVTANRSKSLCAELKPERSEFSDNSYQSHVDHGVPFSTDAESLDLPSKFPEIKEKDATELSFVTQEHVDNAAEESEYFTVEDSNDDQERKGNNLGDVCGQVLLFETPKTTVIEGETTDASEICDISDLIEVESNTAIDVESDTAIDVESNTAIDVESDTAIDVESNAAIDVESNAAIDVESDTAIDVELDTAIDVESDTAIDVELDTVIAYSDSGEGKGIEKIWETREIYGRRRSPSANCTSLENCEQSVVEINDDTDEHCASRGTGKLCENKRSESYDQSVEPSTSSGGSCTVNTRKVRAADFFKDAFSAGNSSDSINVDSQTYCNLEAGSHEVVKTEPDTLVQGLQTDENSPQSPLGNMVETGDEGKTETSSDLAGPSCSSQPSVFSRLGRRRGKIANVWSDISSGWKELSRDHDEPADKDETGVGISDCTELPSDVSSEALAAYKEVFKKEIAMTEQKIINGCFFIDPCDGLSECQIKKLLRLNASNPEVEQELRLEYDILDLDKDVSKIQDCLDEVRSQLSRYRSLALDRTYDDLEQKFNILLVKKEMYQYRLTEIRRYQKSHFVHVMPREFLFDDEIGKYISLEGMLLFLHKPTISVQNCVRLAALKKEIVQTRDVMAKTNVKQVDDVTRMLIKLRWLHLQRKVLLQQLCCTTEKGRHHLIQYLVEKLAWYRGAQSEMNRMGDQREDVNSFVWETISAFESYIKTLKSVQRSATDGRWTLGATQTFRKRDRSRSSVESRNPDSVERSLVKKRRQTEDVSFDGDFDQSTSSRGGWRKGSNAAVYDQEDPRLSEDGKERWSMFRQSQRNLEFEANRSRYEQGQECMDLEDEREQWFNSRFASNRGNSEDVRHEEGKRRWDCPETNDRYEKSSNMHERHSTRHVVSVDARLSSHERHSTRHVVSDEARLSSHERHSTRHVVSVKARLSSGSRRFPVRVERSDRKRRRDRHENEGSSRKRYARPYYEDSGCSRSWFSQGHYPRRWPQHQ